MIEPKVSVIINCVKQIITFIHKNGDKVLDKWVATDVIHSGQGTSSDNYGGAARNLDLILKANIPAGYEDTVRIGTNYRSLKTMYAQSLFWCHKNTSLLSDYII